MISRLQDTVLPANLTNLIADLRQQIHNLDPSGMLCNAFYIARCHKHWSEPYALVVHLSNGNYFIRGIHKEDLPSDATAVSWYWDSARWLPYEWTTASINAHEYARVIRALDSISGNDSAIGLSLDFKFKKSLFAVPAGHLEIGIPHREGEALIIKHNSKIERASTDIGKVGWSCFEPSLYTPKWLKRFFTHRQAL